MAIYESSINNGIEVVNDALFHFFLYSNIIISIIFFIMARKLVKYSDLFEPKNKDIKIKATQVKKKVEYGTIILILFSLGFLFNIIPIFLFFIFRSLPVSPLLDIIGPLYGSKNLANEAHSLKDLRSFSPKERLLLLTVASISLISFIASILGLYIAIFRKIIIDAKTRGLMLFILSVIATYFCGIPLMLRLIANEGLFFVV